MDIGVQNSALPEPQPGRTDTLAGAVEDAEALLRYAAQSGIDLPNETVATVISAQSAGAQGRIGAEITVAFYAAYTRLAALVQPVTIDTLRVPEAKTAASLRRIGIVSVTLAVLVIICSVVTFMTTAMSGDIEAGINHANELAVKLREQVGPPAVAITEAEICVQPTTAPNQPIPFPDKLLLTQELQDFAATTRTLVTEAGKLNFFVHYWENSPLDTPDAASPWRVRSRDLLQLHPDLIDHRAEAFCKIYAFEDVRNFAKNVRSDTLAVYGALAAYVLPVLYALLGAYAFTLRDFSERVKLRTYHASSYANTARTIAAMTAGAIISLFSNVSQGLSLSPLAMAFLVGYGVEAFFAFLDTLLTAFSANRRGRSEAAPGRN